VLPRKWGAHFFVAFNKLPGSWKTASSAWNFWSIEYHHALHLNLGTLAGLWPWAIRPSLKIKILGFFNHQHFQKKLSVIWSFDQINFRVNDLLRNFFSVKCHFLSTVDLVKWPFSEKKPVIWPFCKMKFWSNDVRLPGDSVKWTFGQTTFGQTVFGQMVFWSNDLSVKWCSVKWCFGQKAFGQKNSWNDFSAKWSRTQNYEICWTKLSVFQS
jgi:hypothetical protein